ncbi:hypothetical protein CDD82_1304 [Ophiocordyceps australis]|uniref:Uncharacterized protein n=1 Tax=Ophiocordyceps australis TaxID=1399860 RepID=A0A2C5YDJ9_9HYPO|nr:hypothetical protein CDD82_1304 [Ophiocordyceps australis]
MPWKHQWSSSGQHGCQEKTPRNFSYPTFVVKSQLTIDPTCGVGHVGKDKSLDSGVHRTTAAKERHLPGRQRKQAALERDKERCLHGRAYQPRGNLDSTTKKDCPAAKETRIKPNALHHDRPWTTDKANQPYRDIKSRIHMTQETTSAPIVTTRTINGCSEGHNDDHDDKTPPQWASKMKKWLQVNEASAEALGQQKPHTLRKHGIEPKDAGGEVKMHLPTGKTLAGVTTSTLEPSPETAMRQGARDTTGKS